MTLTEQVITIALCALATMLTRFLPFMLFGEKRKTPELIKYLGRVQPSAVFGMLVVYCLRSVDVLSGSHGLPELLAITVTVLLHLWKRNMIFSLAGGTAAYMLLLFVW